MVVAREQAGRPGGLPIYGGSRVQRPYAFDPPYMSKARDRRYILNSGRALDSLNERDQKRRDAWQKARPLDWTDTTVLVSKKAGTLTLSYGEAVARFPGRDGKLLDTGFVIKRAGKRQVSPVPPRWYNTVRTDTTDKVARSVAKIRTKREE